MIFRLLLYCFNLLLKTGLKIASWKDTSFKERLKEKKFIMQVKIRDCNKGRYYKLYRGKLTSKGKECQEPTDLSIEWSDASTAMNSLMKVKPKALVQSISNAISSGRLKVKMEVAPTFWFGMMMKDMLGVHMGVLKAFKNIPEYMKNS